MIGDGQKIDAAQALALLSLLMRALGSRVLMAAALVMTFALFCWAMWLQAWLAFAIASAFGAGVLAVSWSTVRGKAEADRAT